MTKKDIERIMKMRKNVSEIITELSEIINEEIEKVVRLEDMKQFNRSKKVDLQCKIAQEFRGNLSAALRETRFEYLK